MTHLYRIIPALLLLAASAAALAAAAKGAQDYYWLMLLKPPNRPPVIDPEVGVTFRWPSDSVRLDAVVSDHPGDSLVYEWTQLSGPAGAEAEFIDPAAEDVTAVFPRYGDYLLELSVSDGEFTATVEVAVAFDFLRNYSNPAQLKLPPERVYPMGQKMMITAWRTEYSQSKIQDIKDIASAGFTAFGPLMDTRITIIDPLFAEAKMHGLRAAHRIVNGATGWSDLCSADQEVVRNKIRYSFRDAIREWDDQIDIWLTGTEELSTHLNDCDQMSILLGYLRDFRTIAHELDNQKRPIWMSDVTGVDAVEMNITHEYLDMVGPQMYLERIGRPGFYQHNAIINTLVNEIVTTADVYKIPATVSFGIIYEPISERDTQMFIDKVVEHDLYLSLNKGIQGFQIYSWLASNSSTNPEFADENTWNWYKDAWYKHVKTFTDHKLDYAYLWGVRRDDLTVEILSGPSRIQWEERGEFFDFPTISMQNIQYGDNRYLILTNSADSDGQDVTVRIGNIPQRCASVLDIREGLYLSKGSSFATTLPPLGVKLYRFDKDGDC